MSTLDHTEGKHGKTITVGDDVHVVYGGVGHHMTVERISVHPETRLVQVHGSITVSVPAVTATRIEAQKPQDESEDPDPTSSTPKSKNSPKKEK